jgi:amidohydrolase
MPANQIMVDSGFITASEDSFEVSILGTGGHGAYPHQTVDPTFILPQVLNAIHGIRARKVDPTKAAAISIGSIHAGAVSNVIPAVVEITGTMRSFDDSVREQLKLELVKALEIAKAMGGDYRVRIRPGYISTYNDPTVVDEIRQSAEAMKGEGVFLKPEASMGAEDFSYMTRAAPGAMFMLGAAVGDFSRPHHTPVFDIDERVLPLGAAVLADTTCRLLESAAAK